MPLTKDDLLKIEKETKSPFVMGSLYEINDSRFFKKFKTEGYSKSYVIAMFFSNVDEVYKFLEKSKAKKVSV